MIEHPTDSLVSLGHITTARAAAKAGEAKRKPILSDTGEPFSDEIDPIDLSDPDWSRIITGIRTVSQAEADLARAIEAMG